MVVGINMSAELIAVMSEQWRVELSVFLSPDPTASRDDSRTALLTDIGALVPRPALLPKTIGLMEVKYKHDEMNMNMMI